MHDFVVLNVSTEHKGHHHDHVHDSAVSSVSIVAEGTLDRDEVIAIICFFRGIHNFFPSDHLQNIVLHHKIAFQDLTQCFNIHIDGFLLMALFGCSCLSIFFHLINPILIYILRN
jgi:hypothetical protein